MTSKRKPAKARKQKQPEQEFKKVKASEFTFGESFQIKPRAGSYVFTIPKKLLYVVGTNELRDAIDNERPLFLKMETRLIDQGAIWTLSVSNVNDGE